MSQQPATDFDIVPASTSGTQLATILNNLNGALMSGRSGTTLPPAAVAGTVWRDTTSAITHIVKYYNGTVSTELYSITVATGAIVFPSGQFLPLTGGVIADNAPTLEVQGSDSVARPRINVSNSNTSRKASMQLHNGGHYQFYLDSSGTVSAIYSFNIDGRITALDGSSLPVDPVIDGDLANKGYVDGKFPGLTAGTFTTNDGKTVSFNSDGVIISVV